MARKRAEKAVTKQMRTIVRSTDILSRTVHDLKLNKERQPCLKYRTISSWVPDGKTVRDSRVPVLKGDAGNNVLEPYGLDFGRLNVLNEHGLIISDYNSQLDYQPCIVQIAAEQKVVRLPFQFQGRFWALEAINDRKTGTKFRVPGVALSQVGRELSRIVDIEPMEQFAKKLKGDLDSRNFRMVEVKAPFSSQKPTE